MPTKKSRPPNGKNLKIHGASIRHTSALSEAQPGGGSAERMMLSVEVENAGDTPLHVWASRRAYEYDSATGLLTLYLTDHVPGPPPGIKIISVHPRTPKQVEVSPHGNATLNVPVPAVIRRRVPGSGRGMSFVEDPIQHINQVDLRIQSGTEPLRYVVGESAVETCERFKAHGDVVRASITLTQAKE